MPFNRELLAAVKLEPVSDTDWVEDVHERINDARSVGADGYVGATAPKPDEDDDQNSATKNVIRCLKVALRRSITSISLPEKQRPLNPRKDFSIASTIHFKAPRSSGLACCGAGATRVKRRQVRTRDEAYSSTGGSVIRHRHHNARREMAQIFSMNTAPDGSDRDADDVDGAFTSSGANREARARRNHRSTVHPQAYPDLSSDDDDDEDDDNVPPVDFTFTDFSPMCYRQIREFFHVDAKAYCDVLYSSKWHSIPTPGKSAAQLFFCGRDWVIKTMTDRESEFLQEVLHLYYYHVRDNPYTLLPHFVGHHRLRIGTKTHTFIIMQNVFATTNTIHEKFDLKGSTIGRFASDAEKRRTTCTQKDLDINSPLHVGSERRALLIEQIKQDCEFLKRAMIMDYSFLVGIHVLPSTADATSAVNTASSPGLLARSFADATLRAGSMPAQSMAIERMETVDFSDWARGEGRLDGRCFTADQGGTMSNKVPGLRQEIYYIGIIDILQEYNARKLLENVVFGAMYDRTRISCVNSNDYAARFISFMSSIIV